MSGSHPCAALKSIEYDRVELAWPSQVLIGRLLYGGGTHEHLTT